MAKARGFSRHLVDVSASRTVTASDVGKLLRLSGSSTLAVPRPSVLGVSAGCTITMYNPSPLPCWVVGQGALPGQPFLAFGIHGASTPIEIRYLEDLTLVATIDNWWEVMGSVKAAKAELAQRSAAVNGYQRLPGGLIIQWLNNIVTSTTNGATSWFDFPIAFPQACRVLQATFSEDSLHFHDVTTPVFITNRTLTRFALRSYTGGANGCDVLAIGH